MKQRTDNCSTAAVAAIYIKVPLIFAVILIIMWKMKKLNRLDVHLPPMNKRQPFVLLNLTVLSLIYITILLFTGSILYLLHTISLNSNAP